MSILKADKTTTLNGVKVNEYLLTKHNPNGIAMPTASMAGGVIGVTIHNTDWIPTAAGTTPAEQYTRSTVNGNMKDVRVHYYVDNTCAWQNLPLDRAGWHAADNNGNGNRKTIAIECIMGSGSDPKYTKSEDNAARLAAYLLHKHGLGIDKLYTHTYWLNVRDGKSGSVDSLNVLKNPEKNCPYYIIPHWTTFKATVKKYLDAQGKGTTATSSTTSTTKTATTGKTSSYLTYDEFEKKYKGKAVDYDGVAGVQCVDLVDQYLKECFGITGVWVDGARDLYNKFSSYPALVSSFTRVANTRDLVVAKGDIVVWGGGTWGHTAIGNGEGNIDYFVSLEENTLGRHEATQLVKHYFNGSGGNDGCNPVLGVLRPKEQKRIQGGGSTSTSTSNTSSYKVKITTSALNIRSGAGVSNKVVGCITDKGVYTITAEKTVSGQVWGKLKSGAGWICLTRYTKKV